MKFHRHAPKHDPEQSPAGHEGHLAPSEAQPKEHGRRAKRKSPWWRDLLVGVLIALVLSASFKAFVAQQFKIPSESMEDTLAIGDQILVSKMKGLQPVQRGDIVVFEDRFDWLPAQYKDENLTGFSATTLGRGLDQGLRFLGIRPEYAGGYLVKRVIGAGGDHVVCCNAKGQISINGEVIKEPYVKKGANENPVPFDVVVPEGKYWLMGDNRDNSGDSRYHQDDANHGFVDEDQLVGRTWLRYYPPSRWKVFHNPGLNELK